jgi:hypothetical protein
MTGRHFVVLLELLGMCWVRSVRWRLAGAMDGEFALEACQDGFVDLSSCWGIFRVCGDLV